MQSADHKSSVVKAASFAAVNTDPQNSIAIQLSTAYKQKIERNRSALGSIIRAILLCGRQNIPLRGKVDQRSNFHAIIHSFAEKDVALREHLEKSDPRARYLSHSVQNELINLCGQQLADAILLSCKNASLFAIMADESADVSNSEQVALILRYVSIDKGKHMVREEFISFVSTRDTTGETLTHIITTQLEKIGLDIQNVVAQGYDGAGNMSGKVKGVQTRIRALNDDAVYIHCKNHRLNLAMCRSSKVLFVSHMFDVVGDVLYFITASPKRLNVYLSRNENGNRLKRLCPTRWSQHAESVSAFLKNYTFISDTLIDLQSDSDSKARGDATSYDRAIHSFDFVIALCCVGGPLEYLTPLSNMMQAPDCDLVRASAYASNLIELLLTKRNDTDYFDELWASATNLATENGITIQRPRVAGRQTARNNVPADSDKEYWRLNLFLPFIDHLIVELEERLKNPLPGLSAQYLLPEKLSGLSVGMLNDIKVAYQRFVSPDELDRELEMWKIGVQCGSIQVTNLCDAMDTCIDLYPNIYKIFKVLLTTASAERSFSCLRRLKTYLRNTMSDERLSA
ncbi:MAG: DUF4371 domain-containing protein, partial [Sedimenticola sp.]